MASWPAKDPDDVLDYPLSWAKQMAKDSDTIASYDPFVSVGTVEIVTGGGKEPSFDDTNTLVWLTGGEAGETCEVVNRITTAAGRQYDHTRKIKIKEK